MKQKTNITSLPKRDTLQDKEDNSMVSSLSPREIVSELDRYVIGQNAAKRAVAIALRNRWRRQALTGEMRDEVLPKNILMIGPTGVGKTEISRRLSKLAEAPFIKVEATRFTEVGYVGRDVEQIVRDLIEIAIAMEKEKKRKAMGRDGMDQLAIFKAEMKAKKKRLEEEQLEEERLKQEKIDAQKFQRQVEKDRRHAIKQQYKTDAGTERQLSEEDRKHAQIKRWEEENNLKYFELPMEKRRRIKEQLEEEEVFRISKEAEDLNILLDKIGLNLTTIPFSLAQLRAMSLKRRLRTIAAIRIQALGRGFIHRIRIVRRLGGDGASLEQGIDELREKIAEVQKKKLELERIRMEREKKKVEARLMEEKRQRELKAKKKRREMLEQYEMKHNKKK